MKKCYKCGINKDESEFNKDNRKIDKLCHRCRTCNREWHREYYNKCVGLNKEKIKERRKKCYKRNEEWHIKYRKDTKNKKAEYNAKYYIANKDRMSKYKTEWHRNKLKTDPNYRLKCYLRTALFHALKGLHKTGSAFRDLGCTVEELRAHLESKFYQNYETGEMMSWNNWSLDGWHVDHIIPLATIKTAIDKDAQIKICCHYTNLQPLWAFENLSKGAKI